ncbi:MAG TPA: ABC transporter permease [Lacunisphaera sp.]
MLSDLRYVLRSFVRNRGFTFVTVVTLALGIGAAGAIFSVTDWVLFRTNQYPPDVYLVGGQTTDQPFVPVRFDCMIRAYEGERTALAALGKAVSQVGNVVIDGQPVETGWLGVTPNVLPMLGIVPRVGRGFLPGEDREGRNEVVIVSHQFWQQHLGGREDALGRKIIAGDAVCTVVGILRAGQMLPPYVQGQIFRPLAYRADPARPWVPQMFCFVQLAPGVSREQAEAALRGAKVELPSQFSGFMQGDRVALSSLAELNDVYRPEVYWMMLGAVGFLYAIACLNASNLMLVRMLGMRRELCIRLALGGGRRGMVRLLLLECVTLALAAAAGGVLVANWLFPLLLSATGGSNAFGSPGWISWRLDARILGVMAVLTVLTSTAIAILPALRVLRTDLNSGLKDGGNAVGESRGLARLRGGLVVLQAAFAVILLAGAGLMVRTFANFQKIDLGFDATKLAKVYVSFPPDYIGANDWQARLNRLREIEAEIARVPGVRAVGFGADVLLPGWYFPGMSLAGPEGRTVKSAMAGFGRGFEVAAGLRLKHGHWLRVPQGNEVLVNEALARSLWPDVADPTGQIVRPEGTNPNASDWKGWVVAGVVGNVRSTIREEPGNFIYTPESWNLESSNVFVVRLGRELDPGVSDALRRRLYAFDSHVVVGRIVPLSEQRQEFLWTENMANSVLRVLAGVALLLTVAGIFSVLAYTVNQRMAEFGVRMAFGATPRDLARLVLGRGIMLVASGLTLGIAGAVALARFVQSLLFGVSGNDPWVLAGVGGLLLATAIAACAWPARRAAKVDVSRLLRSE